MAEIITANHRIRNEPERPRIGPPMCCLAIAVIVTITAYGAFAQTLSPHDDDDDGEALAQDFRYGMACTATARAARRACRNDVRGGFWTTIGNCANLSDPLAAGECSEEANSARREERGQCVDRFRARVDLCSALGEDAYDPSFDPDDFIDPLEIGGAVPANPYFPLVQGSRWVYEGDGETITVTVRDETKLIGGVDCVVVNDRVEEDGDVVEDTDDWYAQDLLSNVWYCGEIAQNFEIAEGEDTPELVDVDGSWKTFRDFALPGIIMYAAPGDHIGETYRQEFALREAEDVAQIVLPDGSATVPAASCTETCLVTRDFTPIEPDAEEYKYYAPGVGLILEVGQDGSRVELVEFTR